MSKIIILHPDNTWEYAEGAKLEEPPETPTFNAASFFDYVREHLFWGSLSQSQVDGLNSLGAALGVAFPYGTLRHIEQSAYCLATYQWETASTMQPIEEYGGPNTRYAPWYGRGYVQLTWEDNYRKQQEKHYDNGLDYHVHDDFNRALIPEVSADISIYGMIDGDFTGKKLSDYINESKVDYVEARRIVNGTDKQNEIAAMADHYEAAIRAGYA